MVLTIPSAIGLIILAQPIISVIYEHGRFTAEATRQTAGALGFYAIGLAGYAAVKVLAPAFYAIDKRNLPMLVSMFSIVMNFALNWLFTFHLEMGHRALLFQPAGRDHQFSDLICHDAALRGSRNRRDAQDARKVARRVGRCWPEFAGLVCPSFSVPGQFRN
jgi:hypothetical protein